MLTVDILTLQYPLLTLTYPLLTLKHNCKCQASTSSSTSSTSSSTFQIVFLIVCVLFNPFGLPHYFHEGLVSSTPNSVVNARIQVLSHGCWCTLNSGFYKMQYSFLISYLILILGKYPIHVTQNAKYNTYILILLKKRLCQNLDLFWFKVWNLAFVIKQKVCVEFLSLTHPSTPYQTQNAWMWLGCM